MKKIKKVFDAFHNIRDQGKRCILVFKIIGLLKNVMECDGIKGLIWRQTTIEETLKFYWKLSLYYQKIDLKKVWNGVDPPRPVMENSILFIFFIFETFPKHKDHLIVEMLLLIVLFIVWNILLI